MLFLNNSIRWFSLVLFTLLIGKSTIQAETYEFYLTKQVGDQLEEVFITISGISWVYPVCEGSDTSSFSKSYIYRRINPLVDINIHVSCQIKGGGCSPGVYQEGVFQNWCHQVTQFTGQPNCSSYPSTIAYPIRQDVINQNSGSIDYSYHYTGKNTISIQIDLMLWDPLPCPPGVQGNANFLLFLKPDFTPEEAMLTAQNNPDPHRPDMAFWDDKNCNSCTPMGLPAYRINTTTLMPSFSDVDYRYSEWGNEIKFERFYPASAEYTLFGKNWGMNIENGIKCQIWPNTGLPEHTIWKHPNGKEELFRDEGGWFKPAAKYYRDSLIYDEPADSFILYEFQTGYIHSFSKSVNSSSWYPLSAIKDKNGNTIIEISRDPDGLITSITDGSGRQTTFTYNTQNLCDKVTIPDGRYFTFDYSTFGNLVSNTDLVGNVIEYTYSSEGYITSMKVNGATATFSYQTAGYSGIIPYVSSITNLEGKTTQFGFNHLTGTFTAIDPEGSSQNTTYNSDMLTGSSIDINSGGRTIHKEYNPSGLLSKVTKNLGASRLFNYNDQGNLITYTDEESLSYNFTYDGKGNLTSVSNPLNQTTHYTYDNSGNVVKVKHADDSELNFTYNNKGKITSFTDALNKTFQYQYNDIGKLEKITDPLGRQEQFVWNTLTALMEKSIDARGNTTLFEYDDLDRITEVTYANGSNRKIEYSCCGQASWINELGNTALTPRNNVVQITGLHDMEGNVTGITYNSMNQIESISFPAGSGENLSRTFTYDAMGNIASITDANGKTTSRTYDENGNLKIYTDENGNETWFSRTSGGRLENIAGPGQPGGVQRFYDELGHLIKIRNARNEYVEYNRDLNGRILSIESEGLTSLYSYDLAGKINSYAGTSGIHHISRDDAGNITNELYPDNTTGTFQYDNNNFLVREDYPEGNCTVKYSRDSRNNVTAIKINDTDSVVYARNDLGNIIQITYPNQVITRIEYDKNNRISLLEHSKNNQVLIGFEFERDAMGNITQEIRTMPDGTGGTIIPADTGGFYQGGNQITQWQNNNYACDADGNLVSSSGNQNYTLSHNSLNLLTSIDLAGSLTTFGYNSRGFIDTKISEAENYTYTYNHLGRLITRKNNTSGLSDQFIWDDARLIAMKNQGGIYYYLPNQVGSVMALADQAGNLVNRYNYNIWGTLTYQEEAVPQPFKFCGVLGVREEKPDFYNMKNRFYNSFLGRFLEPDPLGLAAGSNLYSYAANNPMVYVDPYGLAFRDDYIDSKESYAEFREGPKNKNAQEFPVHWESNAINAVGTVCDVVTNFIPFTENLKHIGEHFDKNADERSWNDFGTTGLKMLKTTAIDGFFMYFGGKAGSKKVEQYVEKYGPEAVENAHKLIKWLDNGNQIWGVGNSLTEDGSNQEEPNE